MTKTAARPYSVLYSVRNTNWMRGLATASAIAVVAGTAPYSVAQAQQKVLLQTFRYDTMEVKKIQERYSPELKPAIVVVDPKSNVATFELTNRGDTTLALDLKLEFYRIFTDTAGNVRDSAVATPAASDPSLAAWVSDLPARLTLEPHQKKTLTLHVKPPASVAAGEYWARLVATAPTLQRTVAVVVRNVLEGPTGPTVVRQPAAGNLTFPMAASAKIVYHVGAATPAPSLALGQPTTMILPDGRVRTCLDIRRTGTSAVYVSTHAMLLPATGRDTTDRSVYAFEVQGDMHPCFHVDGLGVNAGKYTVALTLDDKRADLPAAVIPKFADLKTSASIDIATPYARPASTASSTPSASANRVPLVEIKPEDGALDKLFKREADAAAKEGKIVLVEIGASWCGPCQIFLQTLGDSIMVDALKDARVVRIDFDQWGDAFVNGPYATPGALPTFFVVNPDGTQGTQFDTNRWQPLANQYGALDSRSMAPPLKQFIAEQRTKKSQPKS